MGCWMSIDFSRIKINDVMNLIRLNYTSITCYVRIVVDTSRYIWLYC